MLQVSHHPPTVSMFTEQANNAWKSWQEFTMSSKFRGKYLQIIPLGKHPYRQDTWWRKTLQALYCSGFQTSILSNQSQG